MVRSHSVRKSVPSGHVQSRRWLDVSASVVLTNMHTSHMHPQARRGGKATASKIMVLLYAGSFFIIIIVVGYGSWKFVTRKDVPNNHLLPAPHNRKRMPLHATLLPDPTLTTPSPPLPLLPFLHIPVPI